MEKSSNEAPTQLALFNNNWTLVFVGVFLIVPILGQWGRPGLGKEVPYAGNEHQLGS